MCLKSNCCTEMLSLLYFRLQFLFPSIHCFGTCEPNTTLIPNNSIYNESLFITIIFQIRDGKHGFSKQLGIFCGTKFPHIVQSTQRYLWLHFKSDESIEYEGFQAVYEYIPRNVSRMYNFYKKKSVCYKKFTIFFVLFFS